MVELQQAIYLKMAGDAQLLNLLGLDNSADESEISKRLVPTPPGDDMQSLDAIIHFAFPPTALLRSPEMERRPVQFRIWSSDNSLSNQQKISRRLQELFVGEWLDVAGFRQYSEIFYEYETQIPGVLFGKYGWMVQMEFHSRVVK